jgi:hypothetical protein
MRRLESDVRKYGAEFGPKLFHALQCQVGSLANRCGGSVPNDEF